METAGAWNLIGRYILFVTMNVSFGFSPNGMLSQPMYEIYFGVFGIDFGQHQQTPSDLVVSDTEPGLCKSGSGE